MKLFVLLITVFTCNAAWAGDIEWKGIYRFEGNYIKNPEMASSDPRTSTYMLQHLVLMPKITAYDGLTIQGRFDILNADTAKYPEYANSAMGDFMGGGVGSATPAGAGDSNTLSRNEQSSFINVNELYLTYAHEFGVLTVGRAPIHFGLGMAYNNGHGAFDHWFDNRDLVAYKFVTGNLFFMPVIAKLSEKSLNTAEDVDDYMMQVQYENPDTDLNIGLLYRRRHASTLGNDLPAGIFGAASTGTYSGEFWNFYLSRYVTEALKFALEFGMQKGPTGVPNVELDGYGVALEVDYAPQESSFNYQLKAGMATGDDPNTTNYEGYIFSKNYDVAMLMFNHPVGQYDLFRTGYKTSVAGQTNTSASSLADVEALSNVLYFAPSMTYKWSDKFHAQLGLTYATLNSEPLATGVDKAVGFEVDITLKYMPYQGVQWINRMGILSPGDAFKGGTANNFQTETVYGLETKAAITF